MESLQQQLQAPYDLQSEIEKLLTCTTIEVLKSQYRVLEEKLYDLFFQSFVQSPDVAEQKLHPLRVSLKETYNKAVHIIQSSLSPDQLSKIKTQFQYFNLGQLSPSEIFSLGYEIGKSISWVQDQEGNDFVPSIPFEVLKSMHDKLPDPVKALTYQNPKAKNVYKFKHKKTGEYLTGSGLCHNETRGYIFTRPSGLSDKARSGFRIEPVYQSQAFGLLNLISDEFFDIWEEIYCPYDDWMKDQHRRYCFLWLKREFESTGYFQFEMDKGLKYGKLKSIRYGEYLVPNGNSEGGRRPVYLVAPKKLEKVGASEEDLWWEVVYGKDD